jgi:N-acetylmuramoyl-L-alanine amidase
LRLKTFCSLIIIIFLFNTFAEAQQTSEFGVVTKNGTRYIPVFFREGTLYFSVTNFADATLSNYFYNPDNQKIELKYSDYSLKITANNPYLVLFKRGTEEVKIIQIPTSVYTFNNLICMPLKYTLVPLEFAFGKKMIFQGSNKLIIKDEKPDVNISFKEEEKETSPEEIKPGRSSFDITGIKLDEKANGTLVRVISNKSIPAYSSSFKNNVLTIIFRKVNADVKNILETPVIGLIKNLKVKNIGKDTEFRFDLSKDYAANEVFNADKGNDVLITLHNKIFYSNKVIEKDKERWDFNVIVIDPGHGGHDSGAIGYGGVKEKDINLGIALKLGKLIEKNLKDVKVVYTRKTDKFVELYKRGQIANQNNGNLFISIHCNSTPSKPTSAHGIEFYLLRPGRTKEAITIAERENSVIQYEDNPQRYQKLTDENFILVSMAHSAYMKYSEKFSELLNEEFDANKRLECRGVKQAGFYVLVGASMPSVLIESGFISNKSDAAYLKSSRGQGQIAEDIYKAIKKYKEHYEKVIETEF